MSSLSEYNNNPGNLKPRDGKVDFYKGQIGVDANGFAVFKNKDFGRKALVQDLEAKIKRGVDTPEKFIDVYSPAGAENEETGRDNYKLYLAQQLGLSGTGKPFGKEHIEKLADAVTAFEGGTWTDKKPDGPPAKEAEASPYGSDVVSGDGAPEASVEQESPYGPDAVGDGTYGPDVVRDQSLDVDQAARSRKETAALTGLTGAGLGSIYSLKSPAVRLLSKIGYFPGGKPPSPTEAAELIDRLMSREPIKPVDAVAKPTDVMAAPESVIKKPHGGENWQKSLTGISTPGAQMDKSSLDLAKRMQQTVGIGGSPGFTGGTITEGGIILDPRDAAAVQARQKAAQIQAMRMDELMRSAAEREAGVNERLRQVMAKKATEGDAMLRQSLEKSLSPDIPQKVAQSVMRSAPVRGGLAGLGIGYNLQGASQNFKQPGALNTAAGVTNLTGAGLSALGLIPKLAPVANPAAIAATTGAEIMSDLARGDKQAAAESGLTGLTAIAPRIFGPLGALLYSRGLNANEEEEMKRLLEQQARNPNFYSGKLSLPADAWKAP